MKTITLSKEVSIPLMDYATQATALLGIKGAGKSQSGGFLAEQLMIAGIPITALDPAGVWRYLKVPGRGDGFPVVVVGGEDADFPLSENTVEDITRAAMKEGVSLVIDLFTSRPSKSLIRSVVLKCVETMFYENKKHGIRHVFLEECAEFCPQRIMADHARVYGAVEQLVRIGGNCSLGVTMINPRAENLNKDVLELCDFMFLHRQRGRNSLKNLDDWFEQSEMSQDEIEKVIAETMRLEAGQCWFMSKESANPLLVQMPLKRSFHPDRKNPQAEIKAVKRSVDVAAWVEKVRNALPKPEEKKPKAPIAAPKETVKEVEKIVEIPILTTEDRKLLEQIRDAATWADGLLKRIDGFKKPTFSKPIQNGSPRQMVQKQSHPKHTEKVESNGETPQGGLRRMMIALAQRPQGMTSKQIGVRAGLSSSSGTFGTYLGKGRSMNWIVGSRDHIEITPEGIAALGEYEPLPTGKALLDYWVNDLEGGASRMLSILAEAYPEYMDANTLGERAEISSSSGTFGTYLGKLRTLELVNGKRDGLRASDELFD